MSEETGEEATTTVEVNIINEMPIDNQDQGTEGSNQNEAIDSSSKRFSVKSSQALDALSSFESIVVEHENYLFKSEEMDNTSFRSRSTDQLVDLKNRLALMTGDVDKLQFKGIDSIQTVELESGKTLAKEKRRDLNRRIELIQKRITEMHQEIMDIVRSRDGSMKSLKLFIASWNVGNALPNVEELKKLLPVGGGGYDIVSIGLQECDFELTTDMKSIADEAKEKFKYDRLAMNEIASLQSFEDVKRRQSNVGDLKKKEYTSMSKAMETTAKRAITSKAGLYTASLIAGLLGSDYFLLRDCEYMQMRHFVFAKFDHMSRITNVEFGSEATGIASVIGNKGGLFIAFEFQGVRMCFASCHLAAHEAHKYLLHRNQNCDEILNSAKLYFGNKYYPYFADWDYMFLYGDLNYRLDPHIDPTKVGFGHLKGRRHSKEEDDRDSMSSLIAIKGNTNLQTSLSTATSDSEVQQKQNQKPKKNTKVEKVWAEREKVLKLVKGKEYDEMLKIDQLKKEIREGRALWGFEEGLIRFDPTFKVARGSETNNYHDKRIPSYCDRIFWCKAPTRKYEQAVVQTMLESIPGVTTSDHKPVHSSFIVDLAPILVPLSPLIPGSKDEGIILRITDLEAKNLEPADSNGLADPYVIFHSNVLFSPGTDGANALRGATKTKVLSRRLNAKWHDCTYVMQCASSIRSPKDLQKRYLVLSIWDRDTLSSDDAMGCAVIQFDKVFDFNKENNNGKEPWSRYHHFNEPIIHGSHIAGTISGRIECLHPTSKVSTIEPANECCLLS